MHFPIYFKGNGEVSMWSQGEENSVFPWWSAGCGRLSKVSLCGPMVHCLRAQAKSLDTLLPLIYTTHSRTVGLADSQDNKNYLR